MNTQSDKLSVLEKVGYSLGDLAANLVFQTLVTYIVFFYTDVYKLAAGPAQTVIFWGGIIGGVLFAPIMGIIADRTNTRWGKYRPWVLWTAIPFAVMIFLTFTTPNLSDSGKFIYAFITYALMVTLYSANNLPYSSLSGVLTGNMADRNSLSSYRFVAVMGAQFIVQVLMLPIILMVGKGDQAKGFEIVMTVFAVAGVICFIITFLTTRERVVVVTEKESNISDDLKDLAKNYPWAIMLGVIILVFTTLAMKGGMYIYYFNNYVDKPALGQFLTNIGFYSLIDGITAICHSMGLNFEWPREATASGYGLFNGGGVIMMIVGIGFSKPLADRFGKRNIYMTFLAISAIFILAFIAFPKDAIPAMFISQILHGFFYGITIPLMWTMIADVADYSEWKNTRRATGIIFSASILGLKGGLTLGGTLASMVLEHHHYNPDLPVQAEDTIQGIRLAISLYAAIPFLIATVLLFFYEINKRMETQIESDLAARRPATI